MYPIKPLQHSLQCYNNWSVHIWISASFEELVAIIFKIFMLILRLLMIMTMMVRMNVVGRMMMMTTMAMMIWWWWLRRRRPWFLSRRKQELSSRITETCLQHSIVQGIGFYFVVELIYYIPVRTYSYCGNAQSNTVLVGTISLRRI